MSPDGGSCTVLFDPASRAALGRRVTQKALRRFAADLEARVARRRPFTIWLAGDAQLAQLNKQFRGKRGTTDVLSFPSGQSKGFLGEIAISADCALRQAADFGHGLGDEICILMLHGVLHLLGHDHESDGGEMRRVEARWRKAFGLPPSLTERARA